MYEQFFNFSAEPFRLSPDHAFAYAHKGYSKAQAYMVYAFHRAEGFVMITGRPGTGKTTLIGALLYQLADEDVTTANLVCTQLKADDLLKMVAYEFGISPAVVEKGELLQRLTQQLKFWHREARRVLLIVDEAQDLSASAMEELRLLTNIQLDSRPLLQIFLLGQPELRELILSPRMEQVHQRIIAASHIEPLESDETGAYIRHRLESVGWRGDPAISEAVYPLIHKFSEGIPRRINLICSRLLLHCAVEQRHRIRVADFREVIGELQDEKLAAGREFCEQDFDAAEILEAEIDRKQKKKIEARASGEASSSAAAHPLPSNARTETGKQSALRAGVPVSREADAAIPRPKDRDPLNNLQLKVVPGIDGAGASHRTRANGGRASPRQSPHQDATRKPDAATRHTAPPESRPRADRRAVVSSRQGEAGRIGWRTTSPPGDEVDLRYKKNWNRTGGKSLRRKRDEREAWITLLILILAAASLVLLAVFWPIKDIELPRLTCVVTAAGCGETRRLEEPNTKNFPHKLNYDPGLRK